MQMINEIDKVDVYGKYFYNKVRLIITLSAVCDYYKVVILKAADDPKFHERFNTNLLRDWTAGEIKNNKYTKNGYLQHIFQSEFGLTFNLESTDFTSLTYCYADAAQSLMFATDLALEKTPFLERFKKACCTTIDKSVKVKELKTHAASNQSSISIRKDKYQLEVSIECCTYNISMTIDSKDGGVLGYRLNSESIDKGSSKAAFLQKMLPYLRDIALVRGMAYCIEDSGINPAAINQI